MGLGLSLICNKVAQQLKFLGRKTHWLSPSPQRTRFSKSIFQVIRTKRRKSISPARRAASAARMRAISSSDAERLHDVIVSARRRAPALCRFRYCAR